jgi:hypothetical protein
MKANARAANDRAVERDVTASELAAFKYCAKAWHLEHVARVRPSAGAASERDAGVSQHRRHGAAVRAGSWLASHARASVATLLVVAVLLFFAAFRV